MTKFSNIWYWVFLVLAFNMQAQDDFITSPTDTAGMGDMLRVKPDDVKMTPQEEATANDSLKKAAYLLQRLKDVVNIKKDVLYGHDVYDLVRELKDSNFVLVQPVVSIDAKGVMIGLINQVGCLFEGNDTEPWIRINTKLKPLKDREIPFNLIADITGSKKVKAEWLTNAKTLMEGVYKGKAYADVDKASDDITKAYQLALGSLKNSIGKTFTPPFVLKLNDTKYWGGTAISIWQKKGADSTVMLEAQAPDGSMLSGDIDWPKTSLFVKTNYDQAWINCKNIGRYEFTVTYRDTLKQNFVVNIASSDAKDIIDDFLRKLAQEAVSEIISSGIDDITKNYTTLDSVATGMQTLPIELSSDLNGLDFGISGTPEDLEKINFDNSQVLTASTKSGLDKINSSSSYMLKYNLAQALIKRKALIILLANQAIFDTEEFTKLLDNLRNNFINTVGGLTAELIIKGLQPDSKAQVKAALKTYLSKTFETSAQNIEKK